jgi:hypothetical protein
MGIDHLVKIIDEGKKVSFYTSSIRYKKYVCCIEDMKDEEHLVYGDTVIDLLQKLERKEFNQKLEID